MLRITNLSKSFQSREVLRNINLEVGEGEIVAIMGSSGGGKTTLLRCSSGLVRPTSGKVEVDGIDVDADPEHARRRMGMVFQQAALFDYLTVSDNVLFGARRWFRLSKTEEGQVLEETLHRVGLEGTEGLYPAELSGGMRKRVGIARALALRPKLMLYDEPTTGLDPITAYTIDSLIVELRRELKVTSVVVSHDVSSVYRVADRVAFLESGQLTFVGSPDEFVKSPQESIRELVYKSEARELGTESA